MALAEEMESAPRQSPGLLKTLESVISIVRQSREAEGEPAAQDPVDREELLSLFKTDLADRTPAPRNLSSEQQEAEDLARIRAALYSS